MLLSSQEDIVDSDEKYDSDETYDTEVEVHPPAI